MQKNSELLLNKMSKAYMDPEVEEIPELQKYLLICASKLNNDESYSKVVVELSSKISAYYLRHHNVAKSVLEVYNFIKAEVAGGNIDAAEMRKHVMGLAMLSCPINCGPF